jgi:hypothetical protein
VTATCNYIGSSAIQPLGASGFSCTQIDVPASRLRRLNVGAKGTEQIGLIVTAVVSSSSASIPTKEDIDNAIFASMQTPAVDTLVSDLTTMLAPENPFSQTVSVSIEFLQTVSDSPSDIPTLAPTRYLDQGVPTAGEGCVETPSPTTTNSSSSSKGKGGKGKGGCSKKARKQKKTKSKDDKTTNAKLLRKSSSSR